MRSVAAVVVRAGGREPQLGDVEVARAAEVLVGRRGGGLVAGVAVPWAARLARACAACASHEPPVTSQIAVCIPPLTAGATLGMATAAAPAKVTTPARTASHSTMVCPLSRMVQDDPTGPRGAPWAGGTHLLGGTAQVRSGTYGPL